jgi:hypothetical protein
LYFCGRVWIPGQQRLFLTLWLLLIAQLRIAVDFVGADVHEFGQLAILADAFQEFQKGYNIVLQRLFGVLVASFAGTVGGEVHNCVDLI